MLTSQKRTKLPPNSRDMNTIFLRLGVRRPCALHAIMALCAGRLARRMEYVLFVCVNSGRVYVKCNETEIYHAERAGTPISLTPHVFRVS